MRLINNRNIKLGRILTESVIFQVIFSYMYILLKSSFEKYKYNYYRKKYNIHPDFEFLGHGTVITGDGDVILGKKSHLNSHCYIACGKGSKVIIGENCHVGHYVTIYAGNIDTENYHPENIRVKPGDVIIEDGCFIGSFTIIPKGVKIGRNSIIGAGSVVTRDIPPNSLAAGVPATIIKKLT